MHDISNTTQGENTALTNKDPFAHPNDPRLKWLVEKFLPWLESWKTSTSATRFLTNETYQAIKQATMATVGNIPYLLSTGMDFVLTRKFTSDNIERLFSSLRKCNGANYNMDAKSSVKGVEKILRTGICYVSLDCNAPIVNRKNDKTE